MKKNPWAEVCWYFPDSREQFRLGGNLEIVGPDHPDERLRQVQYLLAFSPCELGLAPCIHCRSCQRSLPVGVIASTKYLSLHTVFGSFICAYYQGQQASRIVSQLVYRDAPRTGHSTLTCLSRCEVAGCTGGAIVALLSVLHRGCHHPLADSRHACAGTTGELGQHVDERAILVRVAGLWAAA